MCNETNQTFFLNHQHTKVSNKPNCYANVVVPRGKKGDFMTNNNGKFSPM